MDGEHKLSYIAEYHEGQIDNSARKHKSWALSMSGLCKRCNNGWIYATERQGDPTVLCTMSDPPRQMPTDISECSKFSQIGVLTIWELSKLALDVDIGNKPRTAGFAPKKEKEKDD